MTRKRFLKKMHDDDRYIKIGAFENEYGERYIVYCLRIEPLFIYVAGDETDWELLKVDIDCLTASSDPFIFDAEETEKLMAIRREHEHELVQV